LRAAKELESYGVLILFTKLSVLFIDPVLIAHIKMFPSFP